VSRVNFMRDGIAVSRTGNGVAGPLARGQNRTFSTMSIVGGIIATISINAP
jgi:hypothetical protein